MEVYCKTDVTLLKDELTLHWCRWFYKRLTKGERSTTPRQRGDDLGSRGSGLNTAITPSALHTTTTTASSSLRDTTIFIPFFNTLNIYISYIFIFNTLYITHYIYIYIYIYIHINILYISHKYKIFSLHYKYLFFKHLELVEHIWKTQLPYLDD